MALARFFGECTQRWIVERWGGCRKAMLVVTLRALLSGTFSKLCQNWLRHWRGTLYLRAAVHRCGQRPVSFRRPWKQPMRPSTHVNMRRIRLGWRKEKRKRKKKVRLDSNDFGFICAGVSNVVSYKRNVWYNLSCQTYCHLSTKEKLPVRGQFSETCGVISYGSGWRKDVVNQCLEFGS